MESDYKSFCKDYFKYAMDIAEVTIAKHIRKNGPLSLYIDVEMVKDLAVSYALEKTYCKYDDNHKSKATIGTLLSRIVHNCVLTELKKEARAVQADKRDEDFNFNCDLETNTNRGKDYIREYIDSSNESEEKEKQINKIISCVKKLSEVDQVIISCWMSYAKRHYTAMAILELGWEDNKSNRSVIQVRCSRAIDTMKNMLEREASFRDDCVILLENKDTQIIKLESFHKCSVTPREVPVSQKKHIISCIDYIHLSEILLEGMPE